MSNEDAKAMYGDGELPGDADLSSEESNGAAPGDINPSDRDPRDSPEPNDDPLDDVADAMPGRLGGDRPDTPAPLP